jgi:hypothetical protein
MMRVFFRSSPTIASNAEFLMCSWSPSSWSARTDHDEGSFSFSRSALRNVSMSAVLMRRTTDRMSGRNSSRLITTSRGSRTVMMRLSKSA